MSVLTSLSNFIIELSCVEEMKEKADGLKFHLM